MLERKYVDEQENTSEKSAWSVLFCSGMCSVLIILWYNKNITV